MSQLKTVFKDAIGKTPTQEATNLPAETRGVDGLMKGDTKVTTVVRVNVEPYSKTSVSMKDGGMPLGKGK